VTVDSSSHSPFRQLVFFFLLAFVITWIVWVPRAFNVGRFFDTDVGEILGMVWSYGPALAAMAVALATQGRAGLRELGSRLETWRVGWVWYAVAILGPLAMALAGGLINLALGGTVAEATSDVFEGGIVAAVLVLLVLSLTDGLGEETGWRGYALPRLLKVTGAVEASLILGLVWATWHLPLFWTEGSSLYGSSVLVLFLRLPATSIIFTWLFQRTKGSLLLAILFHAALNLFGPAPGSDSLQVPLIGVAVQWVVALLLIPQVRRLHVEHGGSI
jgi:hypothetical protein